MTYTSPFGAMDTEHEWPDALCLSRTHCSDASEETLREFFEGATALIDLGTPQPAFFLVRQLAELALKTLLGPGQRHGHDLGKLLTALEEKGDDLLAGGSRQQLLVEFIRDLHRRDPKGDQGRYPTTSDGKPSLADVCCANPQLFREYVNDLFFYTYDRLDHTSRTA
ncbi:hypothetical protein [Streptomyces sp. NRRL B-24484]|uniref:hypothetical protein n=1 Tax=Streptomyces sp. NRRL B-24484 TaxID=1463833 RepID=UPI001331A4F4|nr:hypothetical protein [Streptomyces sp. NRRL B-24484]